jgi:hypothetical protein
MPVLTLLAPVANSARNVSRSTLAVLHEEWARGEALTKRARSGSASWDVLFEPVDALSEGEHFLLIEAHAPDEDALARYLGWLDGHVTGLVVALEAEPSLRLRPFAGHRELRAEKGLARGLVLGVDRPASAGMEAVVERFVASFSEWAERPVDGEVSISVVPRARLLERLEPSR